MKPFVLVLLVAGCGGAPFTSIDDAPKAEGKVSATVDGGTFDAPIAVAPKDASLLADAGAAHEDAVVDVADAGVTLEAAPVAPVVDASPEAAPVACDIANCPHVCTPVYQTACCKADQTCGCQVVVPSPETCL